MNQPTLTTERLILRPFCLEDAEDVQRLAGDRAIADTTLNVPHPYQDGFAENWIGSHAAKYDAHELAVFAITLSSCKTLIGSVGVTISSEFQRGSLGYWIGVPFWGQGYCTEAARSVVAFAFPTLKLHRVEAQYLARNSASGRIMEKIGMTREGILRGHAFRWGKHEDVVVYGKLVTD